MKNKPNGVQQYVNFLLADLKSRQAKIDHLEGRLAESRKREILLLEQLLIKEIMIENLLADLDACQDDQK